MQSSVKKLNLGSILAVAAFVVVLILQMIVHQVHAAGLTQVLVRFDRMKVSTATTGTVCAKPASIGVETTVKVDFPTGYTLGAFGTFTVAATNNPNWPAGAVNWIGILTATNVASQAVTFPSGDLTVGTLYCFDWTSSTAVSVKAGATTNTGVVTTQAAGPTTIDSSAFTTVSIADDQIAVSASVPQTFSFTLSGNTDALGSLGTGGVSVSPTPRTATVNTNAKNGWYVWAQDANTGLNSPTAAKTIASTTPGSNSTLSAGTEGYNTGVTQTQVSGSGTLSIPAAFVGGSVGKGGGLDTSLRTVVSSNGTANTAVVTLTNNAAIATLTPSATDYADTITVVGAGLF